MAMPVRTQCGKPLRIYKTWSRGKPESSFVLGVLVSVVEWNPYTFYTSPTGLHIHAYIRAIDCL